MSKKYKLYSMESQNIILYNLDIMAIISSFLPWEDTVEYVCVCKTWLRSFRTRNWSSPKYLSLPYYVNFNWKRKLYMSQDHIKYAGTVFVNNNFRHWFTFIGPTGIKKIHIFSVPATNDYLHELSILRDAELTFIGLLINGHYDPVPVINFLNDHRLSLTELDLDSVSMPIIKFPNITTLTLHIKRDANLDFLDCCPNLKKAKITYWLHPLREGKDYFDCIKRIYEQLSRLEEVKFEANIGQLLALEDSATVVHLPILLKSTTLKKIHINLSGIDDGSCDYIQRIDPKICKITLGLMGKIIRNY